MEFSGGFSKFRSSTKYPLKQEKSAWRGAKDTAWAWQSGTAENEIGAGVRSWFCFYKMIPRLNRSADDRKGDLTFTLGLQVAIPNTSGSREPYRLESRTLRAR